MEIINLLFNDFKSDIRVWKESKSLVDNGYGVTVVATASKGLPKKETKAGIKIVRLSLPIIFIFPFSLLYYWIAVVIKYRKYPVFHCNDIYSLPPGAIIKVFFNKNAKVVYDCHELETEAHVYKNRPGLKQIVKLIERLCIKKADEIITVSPSIAEDYKLRYSVRKPELVLNCPYFKEYKKQNIIRKKLKIPEKKKIILYQGDFTKSRGIEMMIRAFNQLEDSNYVLVLLGEGPEKKKLAKKISAGNIYFLDRVPVNKYMELLVSADIGIHLLENICLNNYYALPNKFFEYVMAGLPVVVSNMKEMSKIVKKYNIGIVLKNHTDKELVRVVNNLTNKDINTYKQNLSKVTKIYNWENQEKTLINIYEKFNT